MRIFVAVLNRAQRYISVHLSFLFNLFYKDFSDNDLDHWKESPQHDDRSRIYEIKKYNFLFPANAYSISQPVSKWNYRRIYLSAIIIVTTLLSPYYQNAAISAICGYSWLGLDDDDSGENYQCWRSQWLLELVKVKNFCRLIIDRVFS